MTDITDFIQAAVADKPVAAQKAFAAAMSDRVDDALTAKYDEVTQQMFNGVEVEQELDDEVEVDLDEFDADLETEMEDNDV